MVMTYGQLIDHDFTLTEFTVGVDPQTDCGVSAHPCPSPIEKPDCIGVNITGGNNLLGDISAQCTPVLLSGQNEMKTAIRSVVIFDDT